MSTAPVFERADGRFVATDVGRGPWDPRALHGGAPAALLMREFERLPAADGLCLARVTYEFMRPVPVGPLDVHAEVVRPGRRVQLLEASIVAGGTEVVRARALQIQSADAGGASTDDAPPPPGPEHGRPPPAAGPAPPDVRLRRDRDCVRGRRLGRRPVHGVVPASSPIVPGETPSPLQRLAAAGDFGNGISATLSWDDYLYINPDLTLYVEREPVGDWICLESETRIARDGIGVAESILYDERGRVGRATQALLVAPR